MRRLFSSKGTWFRLRHLQTRQEFWLGSLYLSPSLTTLDAHGYLAEHLNKLPATTLPVYLSGDTNASLIWAKTDEVTFPYGNESKPKMLLDTLQRYRMNVIPPAEGQLHQPTSRPRRDDVEGHAIDWIACKNTACLDLRICTDSSKELGTDHDCLRVVTGFQSLKDTRPRIVSGTRVLTSEPVLSDKLDQGILTSLADTHTKRPTVPRYRDTNATKELFRIAKRTRTAYTWKRALRARQQDYQSWREQRTAQAMEGDWQALKQSRPNTNKGWESKLAEHLQPEDPTLSYTVTMRKSSLRASRSLRDRYPLRVVLTFPTKSSPLHSGKDMPTAAWGMTELASNFSGLFVRFPKGAYNCWHGTIRSSTREPFPQNGLTH